MEKKSTENESRADAEMAMLEECIITIDCQPLIDAVPVVRCKDCWYCDKHTCYLWGEIVGIRVSEDGYCSFGRRKDDSN